MPEEQMEWFPMYAEKFLIGTANMKPHEVGAYIRLLIYQWRKGFVPCEEKEIRKITGLVRGSLKAVLDKFKRVETVPDASKPNQTKPNIFMQQETLEHVRNEQLQKRKKRSLSATTAATARWERNADAMRPQCDRMPIEEKREEEKRENTEDSLTKFKIDDCFTIALRDPKWVKDNIVTPEELADFNKVLAKRGVTKKTVTDYKEHFSNWKDKKGTTYQEPGKKKMVI